MMPSFTPFAGAYASAASALLSAAWQGILLVLSVGLVLRAIPALSAATRCVIWTVVFALLALLHFAPLATAHALTRSAPQLHASPYWAIGICTLWLAASLVRTAQLLWGILHLRRLVRDAVPVDVPASIRPLLRVGSRKVRLCTSEGVSRPCVLGFFRPRILVPAALLPALCEQDLRQVVLHEMQHLHRRDDWANLFQKLALVLFPLNPALAWVERRLCAERELACDDRVLRAGAGRKAYALCLAHLAEFDLVRRGYALVLGAWERRPELLRRIERIVAQPGRTMGRMPALAVSGSVLAGAMACAITLAHAPRLISFAPPAAPNSADILAHRGQALDPAALSRAIGGSPRIVRATVPGPVSVPGSAPGSAQARTAVVKRHRNTQPPITRLANLRTPPPLPAESTMVVMAAWSAAQDAGGAQRVTFVQQFQAVQPVRVVQTVYVVPTPAGWLVIKI